MKQLLNEMSTVITQKDVNDQTGVLAAGIESIKTLQLRVEQLQRQLSVYQQSPQVVLPRLYNQHVCDIRALGAGLDKIGIAIERTTIDAIVIDVNESYVDMCGVERDLIIGFSISNLPVVGYVYAMRPEHIELYRELCHAQRGSSYYLTSTVPYHGPMITRMGGGQATPASEAGRARAFAQIFQKRAGNKVLCVFEHANDEVVEALVQSHPMYSPSDEPDHVLFMSSADMRRRYRKQPKLTTETLSQSESS